MNNKNLLIEKSQNNITKNTVNPSEQNGWNDIGNSKEEIWKDIPEFEGLYQISNYGNVKSIKRKNRCYSKLLKLHQTGGRGIRYLCAVLSKNNKHKTFSVHRIVAQAFIPNSENKPEINHKDANKLNNFYKNLEWVTRQENVNHSVKNNLIPCGTRCNFSKLTEKEVRFIRHAYDEKIHYKKIAERFGVSISTVYEIGQRKHWKHLT